MIKSLALLAFITLTACAQGQLAVDMAKKLPSSDRTPTQSSGTFKVGNPYQIAGRTYTPVERYTYEESGIASWYGPGFHGKSTASGERFDRYELTAAHRTLQMPSFVRVTNLENGRSLVVRVNDRGPFSKGRIIDLSDKAAELIGMKGAGTARVKIQLLEEESRIVAEAAKRGIDTRGTARVLNETGQLPPHFGGIRPPVQVASNDPVIQNIPPKPDVDVHVKNDVTYPDPVVTKVPIQPTGIYVQTGAFGNYNNALALQNKLSAFGNANVSETMVNGNLLYRVRLGPFQDVPAADTTLGKVQAATGNTPILVVEGL